MTGYMGPYKGASGKHKTQQNCFLQIADCCSSFRASENSASESVEGFSVFKSSKSKAAKKANDKDEDKLLLGRKEYHKLMERDAIFRKKHNIHVSGSNIPSPLQSFTELRSRHNCRSFLVRNLAELGFKEPTPIQREGSVLPVHQLVLVKPLHLSAQPL